MATTSKRVTYIDGTTGLPTEETTDADLFGTGTLAARPAAGTSTGDMYVVIDGGLGIYRVDIWDGAAWQTTQGKYPPSATDPAAPAAVGGDQYYNTALGMLMIYDSTRTKWLSADSAVFAFGKAGNLAGGSYMNGPDGIAFSATNGFRAPWNGTCVSLSYTRDDSDAATFEVTNSGASLSTLASAAVAGSTTTLNNNFSAGDILGVRSQAGSNTMTNPEGWFQIRWRV